MTTILDNPHADISLQFRQGEPLSWTVTAKGVDWSGSYVAQITNKAVVLANLAVSATYSSPDTEMTLQLSAANSMLIPPGRYRWAARAATGEVRIRGGVFVAEEVVSVA